MDARNSERLSVGLRRLDEPNLWESTVHARGNEYRATVELKPRSPAVIADLERLSQGFAPTELRRIGRMLFRALFPGVLADHWFAARATGGAVAVSLHLDAGDLLDLPWEAFHDGTEHCLDDERVSLVRVMRGRAAVGPAPHVNVLVVVSSPSNLPDAMTLHNEAEVTLLMRAVSAMPGLSFEFLPTASLQALERRLAAGGVDILHFIGHGTFDDATAKSLLLLERDEDGRAIAVEAGGLAKSIAAARPKLAVLNACETAASSPVAPATGLAWQLAARGCPAVVAMRAAVGEDAATIFSAALYRAIAAGQSLERATAAARREAAAIALPLLIQQNDAPIVLLDVPESAADATPLVFERPLRAADADRLLRLVRTKQPRAICVIGPSHAGKSTLIDSVVRALHDRGTTARVLDLGARIATGEEIAELAGGELLLVEGGVIPPFPPSVVPYYLGAWPTSEVLRIAAKQTPALPFEVVQKLIDRFGANPEILRRLGGHDVPTVREEVMRAYVADTIDLEPLDPPFRRLAVWLSFFETPVAKTEVVAVGAKPLGISEDTIAALLARGAVMSAGGGTDQWLTTPRWLKWWFRHRLAEKALQAFHSLCAELLEAREERSVAETLELADHYEAAGVRHRALVTRMATLDELLAVNPRASLALAEHLLQSVGEIDIPSAQATLRVQLEMSAAHAAHELGEDDRARDGYRRAIDAVGAAEGTEGHDYRLVLKADCLSHLAKMAMQDSGDLTQAHDWQAEAAATYAAHGDERASTQMIIRRVELATRRDDRQEFDDLSSRSIAAAEALGMADVLTDAYATSAVGRKHFGDADGAIELFERAFATGRQLGTAQLANAAQLLARMLGERDVHASRAIALLDEAKSIYSALGLLDSVASCEIDLVNLAAKHDDFYEAAAAELRAFRIFERLGNERALARSREKLTGLASRLVALGDTLNDQGEYESAARLFDAVAMLRDFDPGRALYATLRGGIAEVELGRFPRAEALFHQTREEAVRLGHAVLAADALHELGALKVVQGTDLDAALTLLSQSLREKEQLPSADRLATLHSLAQVHQKRGEPDEAMALIRQCVDGTSREDSPVAWMTSALQLSAFLLNAERLEEAESLAAEALETAARIEARASVAQARYLLGWIVRRRGEEAAARGHFEQAIVIGRELDLPLTADAEAALRGV